MASAPDAAFAQGNQGPTTTADNYRRGPGFDERTEIVDNEVHKHVNVCSKLVGAGEAHCDARVRIDTKARSSQPARADQARPAAAIGNNGAYDPGFLQSAYNVMGLVRANAGAGQVVAIVDAYDDPNAQSDVSYYRSYFGLPALPACSTWPSSTACFRKIDQNAGTSYPAADQGWAEEISLDLDMVSAICPSCSILLVEANSAAYTDLGTGVNTAVSLGANVVSNSYGGSEWSGETSTDAAYNHPGVAITASSGDSGYGTEYPAASPNVTAVGGTSLTQNTNTGTRNGGETAWSGAGSGCSAYEPKPTWQRDALCSNRTVADVSADADPNTGVWVYDTYIDPGFEMFGGTSAASPIVGSVFALAGNPPSSAQLSSDPYGQVSSLFDVVSGSNGSCAGMYLCTSVAGYDGPTGLGTPNGDAAFKNAAATQPKADFSFSDAKATLSVYRGYTVTDSLTLTAINGYQASVQLSASGVPAGVRVSFSSNPVTPNAVSRLNVHATNSAVPGTYPLTITATGSDGMRHSVSIQVTVH